MVNSSDDSYDMDYAAYRQAFENKGEVPPIKGDECRAIRRRFFSRFASDVLEEQLPKLALHFRDASKIVKDVEASLAVNSQVYDEQEDAVIAHFGAEEVAHRVAEREKCYTASTISIMRAWGSAMDRMYAEMVLPQKLEEVVDGRALELHKRELEEAGELDPADIQAKIAERVKLIKEGYRKVYGEDGSFRGETPIRDRDRQVKVAQISEERGVTYTSPDFLDALKTAAVIDYFLDKGLGGYVPHLPERTRSVMPLQAVIAGLLGIGSLILFKADGAGVRYPAFHVRLLIFNGLNFFRPTKIGNVGAYKKLLR